MTSHRPSDSREYRNSMQRVRRKCCRRVDYHAGPEALAAIEARRSRERPGSVRATNSAVIDAIVCEWATLTGINNQAKSTPRSSGANDGVIRRLCARAYESGSRGDVPESRRLGSRVICGAKRHRDGKPCKALSVLGRRRCKWHGGSSTGPVTDEGRRKARLNLRQFASPK